MAVAEGRLDTERKASRTFISQGSEKLMANIHDTRDHWESKWAEVQYWRYSLSPGGWGMAATSVEAAEGSPGSPAQRTCRKASAARSEVASKAAGGSTPYSEGGMERKEPLLTLKTRMTSGKEWEERTQAPNPIYVHGDATGPPSYTRNWEMAVSEDTRPE